MEKTQADGQAAAGAKNAPLRKRVRVNITLRDRDAERWLRWRSRGRKDQELLHKLLDLVEGLPVSQAKLAGLD